MLDIKFIRENIDLVKEAARKKRVACDVDELVRLDDDRLQKLSLVETLRAEQNSVSAKIIHASAEEKETLIAQMKILKEDLKKREDELAAIEAAWNLAMKTVPNIPDVSVPEGATDADNVEIRSWGEQPTFSFTPLDHVALMEKNDWIDLERGSKVAGFRGYYLKGDAALLSMALWQFATTRLVAQGYEPMIVPSLVRKETLEGTGYLPGGEDDLYRTQDDDYLAGTAEVATMGYFKDEVLEKSDLPKKIVAFSPCFRREAGAHGKDTQGIFRVHEFYKVEQVVLCEPSHEASVQYHEEVQRNIESLMQELEIPYRVVINCTGDLGQGQVKKYDTDLWIPSEQRYREISSASYFHDFQTRRLNIKYRDTDVLQAGGTGKLRLVHSLNSTALPTPRLLIALLENYQQADGTIRVPNVLQSLLGKHVLGKTNHQG